MKKIISLLILTSFIIFPLTGFTGKQIEKVKINYSAEKENDKANSKYLLKISIDNSNPVDLYLYKTEPNPQNLVFSLQKTSKKEILINKLDAGSYTLIIYESENKAVIENIYIGNQKID